jgi:phosphatidylserine/phosphatidylglycerophosphate/cardiolipin synthase-like enzyme
MIKAANKTIDMEEFYVVSEEAKIPDGSDPTGSQARAQEEIRAQGTGLGPVLAALRTAATDRKVQVRLLIDANFYKNYPEEAGQLADVPNIQVRKISIPGGVQHAKYFVVDQAVAYLGSANFDWLALTHIHEVGLRAVDAVLATKLESVFAKDWERGVPLNGVAPSPSALRRVDLSKQTTGFPLAASPPTEGIPDSLSVIKSLLASARETLKIQVYQYSTKAASGGGSWTELDDALRAAAKRGARVQLMVDAVSMKQGGKAILALAALPNVEVRTVTIPTWKGGSIPYSRLIHSKYLVADGSSAWVGTENWSQSYFTKCRNVGVTTTNPEATRQLDMLFNQVWKSPYASRLTP